MTTLTITFAEFLTIKSALRDQVCEARVAQRRGARYNNAEMAEHYEDAANALEAFIEKIEGQAHA